MKHTSLVDMAVERRSHACACAAVTPLYDGISAARELADAMLRQPASLPLPTPAPVPRAERHQRVPR